MSGDVDFNENGGSLSYLDDTIFYDYNMVTSGTFFKVNDSLFTIYWIKWGTHSKKNSYRVQSEFGGKLITENVPPHFIELQVKNKI